MAKSAIEVIKDNEDFRGSVYKDVAGIDTIGYGFTASVLTGKNGRPSMADYRNKSMTQKEADEILEKFVLPEFEKGLKNEINNYDSLEENQKTALLDLAYRNGVAGLGKSGIYDAINKGDFEEAENIISTSPDLQKAGGVVLQPGDAGYDGITNRNKEAAGIFASAKTTAPPAQSKIERYIELSVKAKGGAQNLTDEENRFLISVNDENSENYISQKERITTDADVIIAADGDYSVVDAGKLEALKDVSSFAGGDAEIIRDEVTGTTSVEAIPGETTSPKEVEQSIEAQKEQLPDLSTPEDPLDSEIIDPLEGVEEDIEEEDDIDVLLKEGQESIKKDKDKQARILKMRNAEKVLSGLKAAAGVLSLSKALRDPEIKTPELSPLITEAVEKQRQLSKSGLTSAEKNAAMSNLDNAYAGAMKNVLRASGGQRGMFLAGQGVVDANRIQGLNQLAAQDAAVRRQNVQQYNQLASSVGQIQLQRDMTVEQMKQASIQQNKQLLGGIGTNLVSDAISDVSWYLNPNRDLIEQAQRENLEGMVGSKGGADWKEQSKYNVGTASTNANSKMTEEEKAVLKKYGKL